jgi:multiple sugar transport system permease protein
MFCVIVVEVWKGLPIVILIMLSALHVLPREPYEAAQIDGASRRQVFEHITLPLIQPLLLVALLFQTIFTLRSFDIIYVLTRGGPGATTTTLVIRIYLEAFRFLETGTAAVAADALLGITLLISLVYFKLMYKEITM